MPFKLKPETGCDILGLYFLDILGKNSAYSPILPLTIKKYSNILSQFKKKTIIYYSQLMRFRFKFINGEIMKGLQSNTALKKAIIRAQRTALETTYIPKALRDVLIIEVGDDGFIIKGKEKSTDKTLIMSGVTDNEQILSGR